MARAACRTALVGALLRIMTEHRNVRFWSSVFSNSIQHGMFTTNLSVIMNEWLTRIKLFGGISTSLAPMVTHDKLIPPLRVWASKAGLLADLYVRVSQSWRWRLLFRRDQKNRQPRRFNFKSPKNVCASTAVASIGRWRVLCKALHLNTASLLGPRSYPEYWTKYLGSVSRYDVVANTGRDHVQLARGLTFGIVSNNGRNHVQLAWGLKLCNYYVNKKINWGSVGNKTIFSI